MKFYKRDPDRALAGMAELSLKQRGAYNSLLDLLYSRDGEVPNDDARVAKMISCHWREWKAVKGELIAMGKIWVEGGMIRAKRVQETIKEASDFAQDQRKRASEGWQKRKNANENKDGVMPPGNALTATPTATATISIPKGMDSATQVNGQTSLLPEPVKSSRKKPKRTFPDDFELTADLKAYSREKLPTTNAKHVYEHFRNHHIANGTLMADWPAAFRTWVNKQATWAK